LSIDIYLAVLTVYVSALGWQFASRSTFASVWASHSLSGTPALPQETLAAGKG
jgi:hypothetical protein